MDAARLDEILRLPPGPRREEKILRVIADLTLSLAAWHGAGRMHGGICPDAVVDDARGSANLRPPAAAPDDEDAIRHPGYAAFEQYTDDPAYPCGPWTDVYGLAALTYFLATGSAPPDALARRVCDDYLPLGVWEPGAYGQQFCAAVDDGLAMAAQARPQTVAELAAAMGASLPPAEESGQESDMAMPTLMADARADEPAAMPPPAVRLTAMRSEHPARARRVLPLALAVVLLLAAGTYAWLKPTQAPVELAGSPQAQARPEPQPEPQAPVQPQPPSPRSPRRRPPQPPPQSSRIRRRHQSPSNRVRCLTNQNQRPPPSRRLAWLLRRRNRPRPRPSRHPPPHRYWCVWRCVPGARCWSMAARAV
ncbi:hypothetical protein BUW96_25050 [Achromobacter insolitus]|nr:hypothetical protein BUW96_25050 [Achromobacter insolitus]